MMKDNLLRRLSALFLALVMTASLCVSPAWAADDDSGTGAVTPMTLSTRVIVLKDSTSSYQLAIDGVSAGETIDFTTSTTSGSITVNPSSITVKENEATVVTVTASGTVNKGQIDVKRFDSQKQSIGTATCFVYCDASPVQAPKTIGPATVGTALKVSASITDSDIAALLEDNAITFGSGDISKASVTTSRTSSSIFVATIDPKQALTAETVTITMYLKGIAIQTWELEINPAPGTIPVEYLTFDNVSSRIQLIAGNTYTLPAPTISPSNATNKNLIWRSSNENVATVDGNTRVITAVGTGTASITVEAENGTDNAKATFTVVVTDAPFSLEVSPASNYSSTIDLRTGMGGNTTTKIEAKMSGLNSDKATITRWTSSNQNVAALTNPNATDRTVEITGKASGTATITAYVTYLDANNVSRSTTANCTVTVLDDKSVEITSISLSETTHTMPADGTFKLTATVAPSNALDKSVTWDSSNKSVATVDENGNVTAHAAGEAVIIAKAVYGNLTNSCRVTVTQKAETISLSFAYDSNEQGTNKYKYTFSGSGNNYINVTAALGPKGTYPPADPIRWTSKSTAVATVSSSASASTRATVTAVGPGKTTITAAPLDPYGNVREGVDPAEIEVTVSGIIVKKDDSAVTSLTIVQDHRETLTAEAFGTANNGNSSCDWTCSDPSIVSITPKTGESIVLTARQAGTVTITARKGTYVATCQVTVAEDSVGVIDGISTQPGVAYQFSSLASQLQAACTTKTGSSLAYITNLAVSSTDQGILYDQFHSSADTGAGVGMQDKYYPGTAPQGQRSLSDLSFVPKNTFSGNAEISYTAWSTDNKSFSGLIRISVNGTGDVMYASNDGSVVTFQADDFNLYHPNLRSVSFTLPLDSRGILYYDYTSASQPGTKVTAGTAYYRTGNPSLNRVSFVPTAGYEGTVTITYTATDTSGRNTTGTVTINVGGSSGTSGNSADIYYPVEEDSWVTFQAADFNTASMAVLGEPLSHVRFTLPASSDGTLFYNYRGFGNYDSAVISTTSYYYGGTPSLGSVSFVPTTTTPGQVEITYTGYSVRGNTFTGTIHIGERGPNDQGGLRYTVFTGKSVYFNAADFNNACINATGASLSYVLFSPLPAVGEGTLRYTRGTSSTIYSLTTSTRCYRTSTSTTNVLLGSVSFLAGNSFTGTVTIPFTGYNTNNVSFTGEVVITVTPPTSGDSVYYGTTASPLRLSSSQMRSACSDVLDGTLSYITFTNLPSSSAGRLYLNYSGFGTGTQVNTGVQYYVSGTPGIDQISFVPRGRYSGQVSVAYTATNTSGKSVSGLITFNITSTGNSAYFKDMSGHTWAGPAVDYLYLNGVTNGVTATTYGPEEHILRGDFVLMLCRAFNFTGGSGYSFADVPTDAYFANAVATAKQLGIVNGDGVNFMPYSELTRQDAMVIFKNALDAAGWNVSSASTSVLNTFPDGVSVASYARSAVSTLVQLGAVNGDNGMLYPYNPITRAEAAVILHFVMTM